MRNFLSYFEKIRTRTENLVALIPKDKMDWSYLPGKFTFSDQLRHIACMERAVFAETILGNKPKYFGCGKDLADGYDEVMEFFKQKHMETMAILSQLSDDDLLRKCLTPGNVPISIYKWLGIMAEHEIHHRGQLYLYLNMLGIQTPPMYGLNSEEVIQISLNSK